MARPMPDPPPVTNATRVASGLGLGMRWSLASSSAQYSMRNFSASSIGRVRRDRLGAAHDVDGVDVELAGDPRGLLVGAEGEHADTRAPGRSPGRRRASPGLSGVGVALVVGRVVLPVGLVQLDQPGLDLVQRGSGRQVEQHRADLGAQEVVRARRA